MEKAASEMDIFVTATGCSNVITPEHCKMMKHNSII